MEGKGRRRKGKRKGKKGERVKNLCCLGDVDKIAIHNTIAAALGKELCTAHYRTRFEASNFKLSPHTNDRPADLYTYEFERQLGAAAFDITDHSPTAFHNICGTLSGPNFNSCVDMPNYAAAVAEQEKFQRYAYLNDHHFIRPLCFPMVGIRSAKMSSPSSPHALAKNEGSRPPRTFS